jgi:hypothetical protein
MLLPARPFVMAGPFWRPALKMLGGAAITMPWGCVYILKEHDSRLLRRHELCHLRQIKRDGALLFSARYVWWTIRHGYWKNPYEIEAYDFEKAALNG